MREKRNEREKIKERKELKEREMKKNLRQVRTEGKECGNVWMYESNINFKLNWGRMNGKK